MRSEDSDTFFFLENFEDSEELHCALPRSVVRAYVKFEFLRLSMSIIKNCPHMLKSDHRKLRSSRVKLMWWVGGCVCV